MCVKTTLRIDNKTNMWHFIASFLGVGIHGRKDEVTPVEGLGFGEPTSCNKTITKVAHRNNINARGSRLTTTVSTFNRAR